MPNLRVRPLTDEEYQRLKRRAASRKLAAGRVKRAQVALLSNQGYRARAGSVSASIPTSRQKGGDRNPLHRCPRQQRRSLPRRDGAALGVFARGQELVAIHPGAGKPAGRGKQEMDYRRRPTDGYVFGAFRPASGEALTATYTSRSIRNFIDFLDQVEAAIPASVERVYAILDNLATHKAADVLLFTLAHPRSSSSSRRSMPPT